MIRARDIALLAICLICGAIFAFRNSDARTLFAAAPGLEAPVWSDGLLQSEAMKKTTGASFLCRGECGSISPWPKGSKPESWLRQLGQSTAKKGVGERPDAPALVRFDKRWVILWGERSDRLEVVVEGLGAGVWPRHRFKALYNSAWWGPLQ